MLLIASAALLPRDAGRRMSRLDPAGLLTLAAAVLLLVIPLVLGREEGWPVWAFASIGGSVVALAAFVFLEQVVARRGGAPLIPGRILRAPGMLPALASLRSGWPRMPASSSPSPSISRSASPSPRSSPVSPLRRLHSDLL